MISPPSFPDTVHVANGCFLSAVHYLARYTAAYPAETGECVAVLLPNIDGQLKPHTLAVISWHGRWWVRDDHYGVFQLLASDRAPWSETQLVARAEKMLPLLAQRAGDAKRRWFEEQAAQRLQGEAALAWRLDQIAKAERLLPVPGEVRWCQTAEGTQPFLYFRLHGDLFGVYDPATGTATATSGERDAGKLVAAVAHRLGYLAPPVPETVGG